MASQEQSIERALTVLSQRKASLLSHVVAIEAAFEEANGRPMDVHERAQNADWVETLRQLNRTSQKLKRLAMSPDQEEEVLKSSPGRSSEAWAA